MHYIDLKHSSDVQLTFEALLVNNKTYQDLKHTHQLNVCASYILELTWS